MKLSNSVPEVKTGNLIRKAKQSKGANSNHAKAQCMKVQPKAHS